MATAPSDGSVQQDIGLPEKKRLFCADTCDHCHSTWVIRPNCFAYKQQSMMVINLFVLLMSILLRSLRLAHLFEGGKRKRKRKKEADK